MAPPKYRKTTESMWKRFWSHFRVQKIPKEKGGGIVMTSDQVRVGDILIGNRTNRTFVVTFVGVKDVVVRKENGSKRIYRGEAFKGFTNLSAKMRGVAAQAELNS